MQNFGFVKRYVATEIFNIKENNAFYERLYAVQKRLPKGGIVIMVGDLRAKVDYDNIFFRHLLARHNLADLSNNGEKFVDFVNAI